MKTKTSDLSLYLYTVLDVTSVMISDVRAAADTREETRTTK